MRHEQSCGVIVVHSSENNIRYLLIQGYGGYWGFPKGKQEPGETVKETALRELYEEVGISDIQLRLDLRFFESYVINRKRGPNIKKKIKYFVGMTHSMETTRQRSEVKQLGWFKLEDAKHLVVPKKRDFLDKVHHCLTRDDTASYN
jgi:8-oxo-dGTP pyrophosphatase MutT (NUDIX family)